MRTVYEYNLQDRMFIDGMVMDMDYLTTVLSIAGQWRLDFIMYTKIRKINVDFAKMELYFEISYVNG